MPTFLLIGKPREQQSRAPTDVFAALEAALAACGGHLHDGYLLDAAETASVVDVPDAPSLMRVLLELERQGYRLQARPALRRTEAEAIAKVVTEPRS